MQLRVTTNLRRNALDFLPSVFAKAPFYCGARSQTQEVDVPVRSHNLVEGNHDVRLALRLDLQSEETAVVGAEVDDLRVRLLVNGSDAQRLLVREFRLKTLNFV